MTKNNILKKAAALGICAFMLSALPLPAFAANSKTVINNVSLSFDISNVEIGSSEKNIIVDSANENEYYVSNNRGNAINNESGTWNAGVTPRFSITIKPESGFKFDTAQLGKSSYYNFNGAAVTFVKAKGGSNSITLTVKTAKLKGNKEDLGVSELNWDEDSGRGEWNPADNAERYYWKLYRGSSIVTSGETTSTSYDFSSNITQSGNYTFKVRAYAYGTYGEWDVSDELYVESSDLNKYGGGKPEKRGNSGGSWIKNSTGWWYANPDRSYTTNDWQHIDGRWYYFNKDGYMVAGSWIRSPKSGLWYYCGGDGAMYTNRRTPDGYYVGADGAWIP